MTFFRKMIEKTKKYATLPKSEKNKKNYHRRKKHIMSARVLFSQVAAVALFAVTAAAQEVSKPVVSKTAEKEKIAAAASGFAPNSGKEAVIDRLKALFSTNTRPIVSSKPT